MDRPLATRTDRLREQRDRLAEYGTPLYVFYEEDLRRNYRQLRSTLDTYYPDSKVHFAVKSNYNLAVLSVLRDAGCGAETYSGCELTATLDAGFDAADVLLTGMNRDERDIEQALSAGVEHLLVDNMAEFERIEAVAADTDAEPGVLIRGNPAMEVPTHPEVATATAESKFGLDIESGRAMAVARRVVESDTVRLAGVQLHIGSQIDGVEPYGVATRAMLDFAASIRDELGVEIDILDMGGGLPVPYDSEVPAADAIVQTIAEAIQERCETHALTEPTLFLEPGRRLVGNAGSLLGTVGAIKSTPHTTFAVLDVGTNTVSSYWPYPIYALDDAEPTEQYDVAGPLCFTGDVIQEEVSLPPLERGDVIAIDRVGAYSLGDAGHMNASPIPPAVMLRENGDIDQVRDAETCTEITSKDRVPEDLQ